MFPLIILILSNVQAFPQIDESISESNSELAKFAANFYLENCIECKTIFVVYSFEDEEKIDYFLDEVSVKNPYKSGIYTIKISNFTGMQENSPPLYKQDVTIIFLNENNWNNVEEVLFAIEIEPYWNIRAKFLVVAFNVQMEDSEDTEWLQTNFKSFWDRQAPRVLQIFWLQKPRIFAFDPFFENFGYDVTNRKDLAKIFEHKIRDMNGCPIRLYHLDVVFKDRFGMILQNGKEKWVGMDGKYFGTVADMLNASIELHPITLDFPADIVNSADHNVPIDDFVKVLAEVYDFDAMANAGRTYGDNHLDHVFLYDRNDMFIVVPRGKLIPRYLYIFLIVPLNVWCCTLSSLLVVTFITIVFRKYNRKAIDIIGEIINNYRLLLNESIPDREQNNQERFVTLIWMFHSIIVATLFQSVLMTTLVAPKFYPDINTLQDLYKTDLKIYVPHFSLVHLSRGLSEENKKILNHLIEIPHSITVYGETIDWIEMYRYNSGVIVSTEQVYYLKSNSKNSLRPDFHVMADSIMPNVQAINIRNEKLFYEEFLLGMGLIRQAGLYHHWRKYNYDFDIKSVYNMTENPPEPSDEVKGLTMEHLQVAFMILILGGAVGFFVFVLEVIFGRH